MAVNAASRTNTKGKENVKNSVKAGSGPYFPFKKTNLLFKKVEGFVENK